MNNCKKEYNTKIFFKFIIYLMFSKNQLAMIRTMNKNQFVPKIIVLSLFCHVN